MTNHNEAEGRSMTETASLDELRAIRERETITAKAGFSMRGVEQSGEKPAAPAPDSSRMTNHNEAEGHRSMTETAQGHPMRRAALHTFQRQDTHNGGSDWIARFYPYSAYPVFFHGHTEADVTEKAEAMRAEAIERHEASVIARQNARIKADAARSAKKATQPSNTEGQG